MNRILVPRTASTSICLASAIPKHYGTETLEDINGKLSALAGELGWRFRFSVKL